MLEYNLKKERHVNFIFHLAAGGERIHRIESCYVCLRFCVSTECAFPSVCRSAKFVMTTWYLPAFVFVQRNTLKGNVLISPTECWACCSLLPFLFDAER